MFTIEMYRLWLALAESQKELGLPITDKQIEEMQNNLDNIDFDYAAKKENELRHDVMAHIHTFGNLCPTAKSIIHLGATSCFVGDNSDIILMRESMELLQTSLINLIKYLRDFSMQYRHLPTLGFTHFQPAQLTTVGKRATLWLQDFYIDFRQLLMLIETIPLLGCKGTTGTQASFLELFDGDHQKCRQLEQKICEKMNFKRSVSVSGQTYTRKIDFLVLNMLSGLAQSAHKMAVDIRLLMNLKELDEPFEKTQVGSSAMAYKRNPMRCERICSLSRYLTSLLDSAVNTHANQWLERTLDDSAIRRLTLPQGFLTADIILSICNNVTSGLIVWPNVIQKNVSRELPFMTTENILMKAVKSGGDRQNLHEVIRKLSLETAKSMKENGMDKNDLIEKLKSSSEFAQLLTGNDWIDVMDPKKYIGRAPVQVEEFISEEIDPLLEKHFSLLKKRTDENLSPFELNV